MAAPQAAASQKSPHVESPRPRSAPRLALPPSRPQAASLSSRQLASSGGIHSRALALIVPPLSPALPPPWPSRRRGLCLYCGPAPPSCPGRAPPRLKGASAPAAVQATAVALPPSTRLSRFTGWPAAATVVRAAAPASRRRDFSSRRLASPGHLRSSRSPLSRHSLALPQAAHTSSGPASAMAPLAAALLPNRRPGLPRAIPSCRPPSSRRPHRPTPSCHRGPATAAAPRAGPVGSCRLLHRRAALLPPPLLRVTTVPSHRLRARSRLAPPGGLHSRAPASNCPSPPP